jgi:hypothetical protein
MKTWKSFASPDAIAWLLEEDAPAVRAECLISLFGCSPDDSEVRRARSSELKTGAAGRIFAKMAPGGWWGRPEDFYMRSKYHGTVWSFLLLGEMGCAFSDERFQAAAEFLLERAQRLDNGGFTYADSDPKSFRPVAIPCLTGNLVWAMAHSGLTGDSRLQRAAGWLAENQHLRDGPGDPPITEPPGMQKALSEACWGRHTCMMGVVKGLKALAAWPAELRTPAIDKAIREGLDFLLKHRLIFRSHDPLAVAKAEYTRFGFPLMWRTDAIEMLEVCLDLGVREEALRPALDLALAKQGPDGRWRVEQSFNGRMAVRIERDGKPGKWVSLRVLRVLKKAGEVGLLD